ncbi:MAG: hypothetical protein WCB92_32275 [Mycobacterium sp.]
MLTLRDHNVEDYASLRDMDSTDVAVMDDADRACLDELGNHLVSTDAWQRFAIWLLHKHFEPEPGEVFVERVSTSPRGTVTKLIERAADLAVTSMRFDPDVRCGAGVIGMEFADPADFGGTALLCDGDAAALAGVAERLRAHGKTERFGVRMIRDPLGLRADEVLVETCDITRRRLQCSAEKRDEVHAESVETTWLWKPSGKPGPAGPAVMQYCMMMCGYDGNGNHYIEGHTIMPD